eukprot:5710983-Pyramimonas_sp.AAC.1
MQNLRNGRAPFANVSVPYPSRSLYMGCQVRTLGGRRCLPLPPVAARGFPLTPVAFRGLPWPPVAVPIPTPVIPIPIPIPIPILHPYTSP